MLIPEYLKELAESSQVPILRKRIRLHVDGKYINLPTNFPTPNQIKTEEEAIGEILAFNNRSRKREAKGFFNGTKFQWQIDFLHALFKENPQGPFSLEKRKLATSVTGLKWNKIYK